MKRIIYPEPGSIWVHYKNHKRYHVVCVARNTETGVDEVIYEEMGVSGSTWARPVGMWKDLVCVPDGLRKRFEKSEK